nr:hypothetical protein [Rhizobium ruizarguesonis]
MVSLVDQSQVEKAARRRANALVGGAQGLWQPDNDIGLIKRPPAGLVCDAIIDPPHPRRDLALQHLQPAKRIDFAEFFRELFAKACGRNDYEDTSRLDERRNQNHNR